MVNFALAYAASEGKKAIRLDVLEGNRSAEWLYESVGFVKTDVIKMYYEDTGWTNFMLYEKSV